ncbi:MAG: MMPL family transporter [Mycobacteriales bacterium]|nr:MMPL family transporter [Mycobacteriales bacterium]
MERLRSQVLPEVTPAGARVHVGGQTATLIDLARRTSDRLTWFVAGVLLLSCLLLALVFRSIVIPLQAAVMNALSIGAALGVVVTVFQHGIGLGLLGLQEPVPIIGFVPLMLFAILFGLSMDYEVFLLSSIREAWLNGADNHEAVTAGLTRSGRVITSAALIMIAVFGSFMFSDDPMLKVFGLGLTVAVALDATVIRCVLVPAVMVLCGRANWWLPAGLERALPRLEVDKAHTPDGRPALPSEVG